MIRLVVFGPSIPSSTKKNFVRVGPVPEKMVQFLELPLNPYSATVFFFTMKMLSAFTSVVYSQVHFRLFYIEANNMNPDHTAPKGTQFDLGPYS